MNNIAEKRHGKFFLWTKKEIQELGFDWRSLSVVALASVVLLVPSYYQGEWLTRFLDWLGGDSLVKFCGHTAINLRLLLYLVAPLVLILLMREKLGDYGLGLGRFKLGLKLCLAFYILYIPAFVVMALNQQVQGYYTDPTGSQSGWGEFLLQQLALLFMLTLQTEFFFRGFLLFGIKRRYGAFIGILVQTIPYVLIHAGKPPLEAFGSLPVGLALGYLAVKTNSIWYGALLHGSIALIFNVWFRMATG